MLATTIAFVFYKRLIRYSSLRASASEPIKNNNFQLKQIALNFSSSLAKSPSKIIVFAVESSMGQKHSNEHCVNDLYFVDSFSNFFSFQLNQEDNPLKISITEGRLQNLKQDPKSIRKSEKVMESVSEVINFSIQLITKKIMQGYVLIDRHYNSTDEQEKKEFSNSANSLGDIVTCQGSFDDVDQADVINKSPLPTSKSQYIEGSNLSPENNMKTENNLLSVTPDRVLIEKSFKLTNFQQKDIDIITQKAIEHHLEYEVIYDKIQVVGVEPDLFRFLTWLYDFLNMSISMKKHDFAHDEVSISTFHRLHKEEIISKANDLNITCDFRYHMILLTGLSQSLKEFKNYLHQVETSAKKALYPKYWDLEDQSVYSEIDVCPRSVEFEEIAVRMSSSLPKAKITKLTRIQNNYLMTHYITNLNMRQEVRKGSLNRHLLFHGTSTLDPQLVYKNFDTGFDLQYANTAGLYGKGLYFAQNASYSHNGYSFAALNGKFQMILADVFVGKSCHLLGSDSTLIKAPEGYDSVLSNTDFFIIYNNFHSYPLYLIEYQITEGPTSTNQSTPNATPNTIPATSNTSYSSAKSSTGNLFPSIPVTNSIQEGTVKPTYNQKLSPIALKRVQNEWAELQADQSLDYFFMELPNETDFSKWIVRIVGPAYTPYEGGIFQVEVTFPWNYPLSPPTLTFQTQIYHPSIDTHGKVCLGAISNWTPALDLRQVLVTLTVLLDNPLIEEPLMMDILAQYRYNKNEFNRNARSWTEKYAT